MSIKLDVKDRKILFELDLNSRQPASIIGKKVNLSKQVVLYRIRRLLELNIIQKFYAVYDVSKLGFTPYKLFLRLQKTSNEKYNEIVEYIKNHDRVQFFIRTDGMFDIVFNILANSAMDIYNIMKKIDGQYGNYIADKEIIIMVFSSFFPRDYLISHKSNCLRKPIFFSSKPDNLELDDIDKNILGILGIDARIPFINIAYKLKVSQDTISNRIKKLEKMQIIQNYLLLPDFQKLNHLSYKVLFSMNNLTEHKESAILEFCRQHPNIWFHSKSLGKWDLEINMDVENVEQFRQIIFSIKENFSDVIKEYITLQVSRVEKFNFYPMLENLIK